MFNKEPGAGGSRDPVARYDAPPLWAYHHVNAYEEDAAGGGRQIVVDVTGYDSPDIITGPHAYAYTRNMEDPVERRKQAQDGSCYRFKLPLSGDNLDGNTAVYVQPDLLVGVDDRGLRLTSEMVRINPDYAGKKYRFSYGYTGFAHTEKENRFLDWALVKLDHATAEAVVRGESGPVPSALVWQEADMYPSEPVFVPDPKGSSEDSGVLLSPAYDGMGSVENPFFS